jgi:hypothetical protein
LVIGVPVTAFTPSILKVYVVYASFTFFQEFVAVAAGVLANTAVFTGFFIISFISKRCCNCFPRVFYKIISWIGVWAILDPLIVLIVDICLGQYERGDWFRFFRFYMIKERSIQSGIVGAYLTFFLMFGLICINGFLFYYYMIFVHMNGRILDLYKRLSGTRQTFFIPNDNEVSLKYLQWVMHRARTSEHQNYLITSETKKVYDEVGEQREIQFVQIYKIVDNKYILKNRMFTKDYDGALMEIP